MHNMLDYLDWRGDLTFAASEPNEVDNLIFSSIVMAAFENLVPAEFTRSVALSEICEAAVAAEPHLGVIIPDSLLQVPIKAGHSVRFRDVRLCGFVNEVDAAAHKQFGAVTFLLPDDEGIFVAFRGTDDTLVGWQEDMELSFLAPVPAQTRAAEYINAAAAALPGKIRIGGHSKGGNLTAYAAAHMAPAYRSRLVQAYSNDGPGFLPEILQEEGYRAVADRIVTFIPQSSIVGMLLDPVDDCRIIKSASVGILQHDPMSWEVLGSHLVQMDSRSAFGRRTDSMVNQWLSKMSMDERRWLTETVSGIVEASDAHTLTELSEKRLQAAGAMFQAYREMSPEQKSTMQSLVRRLFLQGEGLSLPDRVKKLQDWVFGSPDKTEAASKPEKDPKDLRTRLRRLVEKPADSEPSGLPEKIPSPDPTKDVEEVLDIAIGRRNDHD